jgi:hypothetical protein
MRSSEGEDDLRKLPLRCLLHLRKLHLPLRETSQPSRIQLFVKPEYAVLDMVGEDCGRLYAVLRKNVLQQVLFRQ